MNYAVAKHEFSETLFAALETLEHPWCWRQADHAILRAIFNQMHDRYISTEATANQIARLHQLHFFEGVEHLSEVAQLLEAVDALQTLDHCADCGCKLCTYSKHSPTLCEFCEASNREETDMANQRISRVQAAEMIGVSRQTLANWSEQGKGPPYIQAAKGAGCYYDPEEVQRWIEENTTTPEQDAPQNQ